MKTPRKNVLILGALLAALAAPALPTTSALAQSEAAQSPMQLTSDVLVEREEALADGSVRMVRMAPDTTVPGDRLVFGINFANNGTEPATNLELVNPLPSSVRLADDEDAELIVSVDSGASFGVLSQLSVVAEDGSVRAALASDVTHVRWTLAEVLPGESGRLEFTAIIR